MIRSLFPIQRKQSIPSPIDLRSVISEHNDLLKAVQEKRDALQKLHEEYAQEVQQRLAKLDATIAEMRLIQKGDRGEDGKDGNDGTSVDHGKVVTDVLKRIPPPIKVDYTKVAKLAAQLVPKPKNGKDGQSVDVATVIEELKKTQHLSIEHIKGLDPTVKALSSQLAGKIYGRDTSIRGGGDTVAAGSGVTITLTNGVKTISASGGSFSTLSATETPNGSRTVFTFSLATAQPSYLVVDNVWMKATTASGTVNWTWNSGAKQATLTVPAQDDIWGLV